MAGKEFLNVFYIKTKGVFDVFLTNSEGLFSDFLTNSEGVFTLIYRIASFNAAFFLLKWKRGQKRNRNIKNDAINWAKPGLGTFSCEKDEPLSLRKIAQYHSKTTNIF